MLNKIIKQLEFEDNSNNKKYKVKSICNNMIYIKKLEIAYLLGLCYLIFQKNHIKNENIQKSILIVQYFLKLISFFYKNNSNKSTTTFLLIDSILLIAK